MGRNRGAKVFPKRERPVGHVSGGERRLPPWLFQHQDLLTDLENASPVDQEALTNKLNHIHFMDGHILVHLSHPKYEEGILVRAYPEFCLGTELTCHWLDEDLLGIKPEKYQFLHLIIGDGQSMILVPAVLQKISRNSLTVQLPPKSYSIGERQARRYVCHEIIVELKQSGFQARGKLLDFNSVGFRIRVKPNSSSSFRRFNPDALVTIHLNQDQQILFSGTCRCIRQQGKLRDREIVLVPVDDHIKRFKGKQFRNPRQQLVPSPSLIFDHPLLKKRVQLEVSDISTSGFSIYEKAGEGVLMPGMIIPELMIDFVGALRLKCAAQVVYRLEAKRKKIPCDTPILDEEKGIRCGIAVQDMDINTYSHLTHILINALDPHAYVSSEVDTDALWEFFFDSGFIYPKKYRLIQSYRKDFKETYRKLYQESPEIARHFTSQKNGRIYAHISMVRAYQSAWLIHHHAARAMEGKRLGFTVLMQILHYLNDIYRLPSAKVDYVISCFRPENRFPDLVFGGFARALKNSKGSSLDLFSYLLYPTLSLETQLPKGWLLQECSSLDLWELGRFYKHHSGGLLLDILQLGHKNSSDESIENLYDRLGFVRRWKAYSLTRYGELNAVLIVDQSNLGLNLSDLLNSIKILITDSEGLPWEILSTAINQLTSIYQTERVPILIYPSSYLEAKNASYDTKKYLLWIFDARLIRQFTEFLQRKFRFGL